MPLLCCLNSFCSAQAVSVPRRFKQGVIGSQGGYHSDEAGKVLMLASEGPAAIASSA